MKNTADVTGGTPIAVDHSLSIKLAILIVSFYDIHGRKREVLFFYFVLYTTRDNRRYLKYLSELPRFYQNYLAMRNTTDVTGGEFMIAVYRSGLF
jgi:hypothetical protein